ncbi:hypothetical protein B7463_g125, partial [Scytalidium lignicola]
MDHIQSLYYIINHVFLPPKLPHKDDSDVKQDYCLLKECEDALKSFQGHTLPDEYWRWAVCAKTLRKMREIRDMFGDMTLEGVEESLKLMVDKDVLAFHVRAQNAGLIVRKMSEHFSFESFELSPTTVSVMQAGRLQRCFPGPAIAVGKDKIEDYTFREAFAQLLTQLDINTPEEAWPVAQKARSKSIEIRDSIHPKFVTEFLIGILRGVGRPVDIIRIHKRTRDDIIWKDAKTPWRRSPLWLLLRVALQTTLMTEGAADMHERLPSDLLYVMAAKISQRTLKLAIEGDPSWMQYVHQTVEATHRELADRWDALEQSPGLFGTQKARDSCELSFSDTSLSLHILQPYLNSIAGRETFLSHHCDFKPRCAQRIEQSPSVFPETAFVIPGGDPAARLALVDLELWVEGQLNTWLKMHLSSQSSCSIIADLILHYTTTATSTYAGSPEDMSLMFLTTMDLWVALDKCAVHHEGLLRDYKPGFPPSLFDPLLLPKREQMERLARIEEYLEIRNTSRLNSSFIFEDNNFYQSFAVKYYEISPHHQQLRAKIEAEAQVERENKKEELRVKREEYNRLIRESNDMNCEYGVVKKRSKVSRHISWCQKCRLKSTAKNMHITVHEWPLPQGEYETKSAVFELDVPTPISKWRDITYSLLVDTFSPSNFSFCFSVVQQNKIYRMQQVDGLSHYVCSRSARIGIASAAKPFTRAHYGTKSIPQATQENICVNNGLCYAMFDAKLGRWTENPNRCDVRRTCTLQLPKGPLEKLQFALNKTTHTSNEVLAKQSECPKSLNLHEFYHFTTLRSGDLLQWRNIARELAHRILNFHHEETYMLVTQAAWQVGRSGNNMVCRESHVDLEEQEFGIALLSVLEEAVGTVEGNWQGATALRTFVVLAARLLSMSSWDVVQNRCLLFLRRARNIALHWTRDVRSLHAKAQGTELEALNLRVLEMALTCHATFDVDEHYLSRILRLDEDVAIVTECCIVVHDRCPAVIDGLPHHIITLFQQYWRLSHSLESEIRRGVLASRDGLDTTVHNIWKGYQPGTGWSAVDCPNQRWLVTRTSSEDDYQPMMVHYNILDGQLLVNGAPLTRLPRSYEEHATYRRLFGQKVLDIIPSTMGGMVHFAMYGPELIIRTRKNRQICELLPEHFLKGDFPSSLVEGYIHWLDVNTGLIEWRPLRSAWTFSPDNWQMLVGEQEKYILRKATEELVDVRSPTATIISQVLSPIEQATNIRITMNKKTKVLHIHLPRLKLDFLLKDREKCLLESKQFRNMVVDKQQCFGTFTGLVNKLVLREFTGPARMVIVPYGKVRFVPERYHVQVTIDTSSVPQVRYHSYRIDNQLGRLIDNGSLQSRLFRLYLHALTSHCLVDQLTGRTGTEEALHGLAGAATFSFIHLDPVDIELLGQLTMLTPNREYYPNHLQVMQQVDWLNLSPLSQHPAFHRQVELVFSHAESLQVFQERPEPFHDLDSRGESFLHKRANIRDSAFRVHGFGAEDFTIDYDIVYASRDHVINSDRELQTCYTAKLVDEWSTRLSPCPKLLFEIESWGKIIQGPIIENDLIVGLDLLWLDKPAKIFPDYWCTLHTFLSSSISTRDKHKIMVLLSTLSYSQYAKQELVHTLLAFATIPELRTIQAPRDLEFQLKEGYRPVQQKLVSMMKRHTRQFEECPESHLDAFPYEDLDDADDRRRKEYQDAKEKQIKLFVEELESQWPTATLSKPGNTSYSTYILVQQAIESANICFQSWYRNSQFQKFINNVQNTLSATTSINQNLKHYSFTSPVDGYVPKQKYLSFDDLIRIPAPHLPPDEEQVFDQWPVGEARENTDRTKLREVLTHVSSHSSTDYERLYVEDLQKSFQALNEDTTIMLNLPLEFIALLESNMTQARERVECLYNLICSRLRASICPLVCTAQMIPRLPPTSILSYLASDKVKYVPDDWKDAFLQYGISLTALQRAERLLTTSENRTDLLSELQNPGHQDWDPLHHPEWLLLEVENNILIRRDQAQISREMMSPSSGENSVLQLNMGLGKSSVIVPIVAAALADRTKLVRVIVLKPLLTQMFHLLVKKLGDMLNRRIFHMPVSRSLRLDVHQADQIHTMYKNCMELGGILLLQPEHILSFELLGLERLHAGDTAFGNVMIRTQDWLRRNSRDILDESDEILSTRFELIYTVGTQRGIEFGPDRWTIVQHVLWCLSEIAHQFQIQYPDGLEVVPPQPGGFPRIRILQTSVGEELLLHTASILCENGLAGVPVCFFSLQARKTLLRLLTDRDLDTTTIMSLDEASDGSELRRNALLLLRGLFGGGILAFAFEQKRWRVNYGLDLSRTMLAVPYHAKDSPTARSEFSHPDTTLVLTCLSYYYGGLSNEQILSSFEALLQFDHAGEEYEKWVHDSPALPSTFKALTSINLSNSEQCCREVFPPLRFARSVINFYLSTIVFPTEMKEFPQKLSSSGWDIAAEKEHPTTGFSGTNDSRYILPSSIRQCDLPPQLSTNAAVLDCLLQPENSFVDTSHISPTGILDAGELLNVALKLNPPVRVILDVGAQVLELQNEEVVRKWLSQIQESNAQAAIFFDCQNELSVLSRDGTKESLLISPFSKQMDQCLVYLDESHTRGTDLKMPSDYRAIVTLGPRLTKDRLVQACMRMRKLGKGQSVVFCASMEVQRKIRESSGNINDPIQVADVLKWCIAETIVYTKKSVPLWATQGVRHQRRQAVYSRSRADTQGLSGELVDILLEPEAQSLQQRYGAEYRNYEEQLLLESMTDELLSTCRKQLDAIRTKCQAFEITTFNTAALHEEQERELSPENEREQQVELPLPSVPLEHGVHADVYRLVKEGILNRTSEAFQPAFETFQRTRASSHYESTAWPHDLLVTKDFANSIKPDGGLLDHFLRPVHWILICRGESTLDCIVISPYEAQKLLPFIRASKVVSLHTYSAQSSVTVRSLEDLAFCTVSTLPQAMPSSDISRQLNLFAGQLYLKNFEEYESLCRFLGLCSRPPDDGVEVGCDGFILRSSKGNTEPPAFRTTKFTTSPVDFVRTIMTVRRKGQSFKSSHFGKILNGQLIREEEFQKENS